MLNLQCIYIDVSSSLHTPGCWVEFDLLICQIVEPETYETWPERGSHTDSSIRRVSRCS